MSLLLMSCLSFWETAQAQSLPRIKGDRLVPCFGRANYSFSGVPNCSFENYQWTVVQPNGSVRFYVGPRVTVQWTGDGPGIGSIQVAACGYVGSATVSIGNGRLSRPSLSGPSTACNNAALTFTASSVSEASSYTFEVPSGWSINGVFRTSLTTASRTVRVISPNSGTGRGTVRVRANSGDICTLDSEFTSKSVDYGPSILLSGPTRIENVLGENFYTVRGNALENVNWTVTGGSIIEDPRLPETTLGVIFRPRGGARVTVSARSCNKQLSQTKNVSIDNDIIPIYRQGIVDEENTSKVLAYPNPVRQALTVETPAGNGHIKLTNVLQQVIMEKEVSKTSTVLDLSRVESGTYFLSYTNGKKFYKERIQVLH